MMLEFIAENICIICTGTLIVLYSIMIHDKYFKIKRNTIDGDKLVSTYLKLQKIKDNKNELKKT